MDILKFGLLMGLVGFLSVFLPINFGTVMVIVIIASAVNGAFAAENTGSDEEEIDKHD